MEQFYITNEKVTLGEVVGNRPRLLTFVYPRYFADTLIVYDKDGNQLTRNTHYNCRGFNGVFGSIFARDVCSEIVITDQNITDYVTVNYVALPTEDLLIDDDFLKKVEDNQWRHLPVKWHSVYNRPREYPPAQHEHEFYDLYYWDDIAYEIERITSAVSSGRTPYYDKILKTYQDRLDKVTGEVTAVRALLDGHIRNKDDPHRTTRSNLIGPNGQHYDKLPLLTEAMDSDLTLKGNNSLVTVAQMMRFVDQVITQPIYDHMAKKTGNVHHVTAQQANTYTKAETDALLAQRLRRDSQGAANAITLNNKSISTIRTRVIDTIDSTTLKAEPIKPEHIAKGATGADYMLVGSDGEYAQWGYIPDILNAYLDFGTAFFYHEFKPADLSKDHTQQEYQATLTTLYPPANYKEGTTVFFNHLHRYESTVNTRGRCIRYMETIGAAIITNGVWVVVQN